MGENQGNRACVIQGRAKIVMCKNCSRAIAVQCSFYARVTLQGLEMHTGNEQISLSYIKLFLQQSQAQDLHLF